MEYTIALGIWAVCVAAPCAMSWMAGDMVGSARTRRLYAQGSDGLDAERASDTDCLVESWRLGPATPNPMPNPNSAPTPDLSLDNRAMGGAYRHQTLPGWGAGEARLHDGTLPFEEQAKEAERRRLRREALAAMPDLGDLRAHAEAIRQSDGALLTHDWSASARNPDMDRVLRHYENSVHEMKRSKGLSGAAAHDEWPIIVSANTQDCAELAPTGLGGFSRF